MPSSPDRTRTATACRYTLRRFGGRQPLCGIAVKSLIADTFMPAAASDRMAPSRPLPAPLRCTSTRRTPASNASFPTTSAAIPAANGVLLRDPLNPDFPGEFQAMILPLVSVILIRVLLKVARMWAIPSLAARFFGFFAAVDAAGAALQPTRLLRLPERFPWVVFLYPCIPLVWLPFNYPLDGAFFLLAMVLRGPLRVRALVRVRCPRTGRLLRWRMPR